MYRRELKRYPKQEAFTYDEEGMPVYPNRVYFSPFHDKRMRETTIRQYANMLMAERG